MASENSVTNRTYVRLLPAGGGEERGEAMGERRLAVQLTVLLGEELAGALAAEARREARSLGNLARVLLAEGLARRGGRPHPDPLPRGEGEGPGAGGRPR